MRLILAVLVLVTLVPLSGLVIHRGLNQRSAARDDVARDAARLARMAAIYQEDLHESARDVLDVVTGLPASARSDRLACSEWLGEVHSLYPRFADLGLATPSGAVRCTALEGTQPTHLAERAWFRQAADDGEFAVDFDTGLFSGRPVLVYAMPVPGRSGGERSVAWASLDLQWLQRFVSRVELPGRPAVTILDRRGTILARWPRPKNWVGRPLPQGPRERILAEGEGTAEVLGNDGVRRLYAFTPVGPPDAPLGYLSVGLPRKVAYAAADARLRQDVTWLAVTGLLAALVAFAAAGRWVFRPARQLIRATRRLAAGDPHSRVGPPYPRSELGEVSRSFDEMAAALTERHRELEQAVAERWASDERLRAIIDNAPAAISMKDTEGRYLLINRVLADAFDVAPADVVGKRAADLIGEDAARDIEAADAEVLADGIVRSREETITTARGETRTLLTVRFPLYDPAGEPYALCAIRTDITDRIEAQARHDALTEHLQQAQRMEGLGQLAGGVAHDFNNLLAVILNYTDFVVEALPENPPPEYAELFSGITADLSAVSQAARSAADLTRQLLIFSRRDRAEAHLLDLNAVVTSVKPLLCRTIGEDVALEFVLGPDLPLVRADVGRLEQVLVNLAVNGRDAMPVGGRLRITTACVDPGPGERERRGLPDGPLVRLTVADTGTGMPPEVVARAFEPFYTTKGEGKGTGLGLATVFGVVTDAGGAISIDSEVGHGTEVHVHLPPATEEPVPWSGPEITVPAEDGRGETVLLVEDEAPVREVARRILVEGGYLVVSAADPEEALAVFSGDAVVDLVLTDVVMPGMSGPDLLARVRQRHPETRAMFFSGYPDGLLARQPDLVDGTLLRKPFNARTLLEAVRRTLDAA